MKTLGLTGGIGSGKSTVAALFGELGATVVSADEEARRLMQEDPELRRQLIEVFGEKTFKPDGALDRPHLAKRVFGDDEAVRKLNSLVHPRVREAFPELRRRATNDGAPLLVYEAALLVEAGLDDRFDAILVVDAPEEIRIQRVVERDGVDEAAVRARIQHQLDPAELKPLADFIIDNAGDESKLRPQVERVFAELTRTG